uniref:Metaxin 1a n=1 Tax=Oncorhynchus mykiss TaxID=8022 RepID=A0A8C7RE00_ONCMY
MAAPSQMATSELYCWEGDWDLPSVDTECFIVLAYAKFAGAPLKFHKIGNPWRSPTGSLPALKTRENGSLSQPSDIIIHLRKQKYNADFDLSAKEEADTLAFISLLEEKRMPALVYTRWIDPKNYVEVTRRWHAKHAPFPLNFFLPGSMEEGIHAETPVHSKKPSSLDAFVFGYLHLKSLDNLSHFCSNILALYFPSEGRDVGPHNILRKVSSQPEGGDADNEPGKRRKQLGAMLSYALLTGIVAIQHVKQEALDHRSPGLMSLSSNEEEDEEGRGGGDGCNSKLISCVYS